MADKKKPAAPKAPAANSDRAQLILDTCKRCPYIGKTCDGRLK